MENQATIEIRVKGKLGNLDLNPKQYDISDIKQVLEYIEHMLFPGSPKNRPLVSYDISEGSVIHRFQTARQHVVSFNAILTDIQNKNTLDILDAKSAIGFEHFQRYADEHNYRFEISTSVSESKSPFIISSETSWQRSQVLWVDAEVFLYGELTNAGGKSRYNIHLDTHEYGLVTIQTEKDFLKDIQENLLYRPFGVRAKAKQNIQSGEFDFRSLKLIELIDTTKKYDSDYLNELIKKATPNWEGIDPDEWVNKLRGDYEL